MPSFGGQCVGWVPIMHRRREDVVSGPRSDFELDAAVLEHAYRGVRVQLPLRALLVVFVALTLIAVPPTRGATACYAVLVGYAVFAAGFAWGMRRNRPHTAHRAWLALFVDVVVLAGLTLLTGIADDQSWTSDILVNGLFAIPVLAATQLRPGICAAVVVPTVAAYLAANLATQSANEEPTASVLLRTLVLAGLGLGCVALTVVQRSRVRTIRGLLHDRTALLADLMAQQTRERRALSEQLHDGALQYVLAARQDVDELGHADAVEPEVLTRLDHALSESARMLRSTVTELHPAVLEHAGLARALRDLARGAEARGGFAVTLDIHGWPDATPTPADALLYSAARELLINVVKHADASTVRITLARRGAGSHLVVADDGRGLPPDAQRGGPADGHIGLHSQQLRVAAAGGTLTLTAGRPTGTVATLDLPDGPPANGADGNRSGDTRPR
jgi:two-component system NarL family sensor kinase